MVIVDPDLVAVIGHLHDHIGEFPVHPAVGLPPVLRKTAPAPPCSAAAARVWSSNIPRRIHPPRPGSGTPGPLRCGANPPSRVPRSSKSSSAPPGQPTQSCSISSSAPSSADASPPVGPARRAIRLDPHRQAVRYHDQLAHARTHHGNPPLSKIFSPARPPPFILRSNRAIDSEDAAMSSPSTAYPPHVTAPAASSGPLFYRKPQTESP